MRTQHFALGAQLYRTGREGQVIIRTARRNEQPSESLRMRRTWYADPPAEGESSDPPPTAGQGQKPAPGQGSAADEDEPEIGTPEWVKRNPDGAYKELQKLRDKDAKNRIDSREFKAMQDKIAQFEKAQKDASDKKLRDDGELDKLVKQREQERDEAIAKAREAELRATRISVAAEFKLSPTQAKRLQGSTEEELRADAEEMVKEFGLDKQQPNNPQPPPADPKKQTQTTVAPGGRTVAETDEERRGRLYKRGSQNSPLFNPKE